MGTPSTTGDQTKGVTGVSGAMLWEPHEQVHDIHRTHTYIHGIYAYICRVFLLRQRARGMRTGSLATRAPHWVVELEGVGDTQR